MVIPPRRNELAVTNEGVLSLRYIIYLEELADAVNSLDGRVEVVSQESGVSDSTASVFNLGRSVQDLASETAALNFGVHALRAELENLRKDVEDIRNLIET